MKTKNILFAITMAVTMSIPFIACKGDTEIQDQEYRNILKELMTDETVTASMNFSMEEQRTQLISILLSYGVEQSVAESETDKFMNEIMIDLNIEHFLPYCKKHLSLDELNELKKLYSNERYQELNRMCLEATMRGQASYLSAIQNAVTSFYWGNTPDPIARSGGYSDRYLALCGKYVQVTAADAMINNIMNLITENLGTTEDSKRIANGLSDYFKENITTLFANIYYGTLNEQDLNDLINYTQQPAMQKFLKANAERGMHMEEYMNMTSKKIEEFLGKFIK